MTATWVRSSSGLELYERSRTMMLTGDIIAFSGKGTFSELIKWRTGSEYSHVGLVIRGHMPDFGDTCLLAESTTLVNLRDCIHGEVHVGVQMHFLSKRLLSYEGDVWWAPITGEARGGAPEGKLLDATQWLRAAHSKRIPYDTAQAIGAGIDWWDKIGLENDPDFSKLFCSELATKFLKTWGIVDRSINSSEQTPLDVMRFDCVSQTPRQILCQ